MAYLLDANVFISAKNLHYGFDFCPAFWDWLVRENKAGKVYSIERVGDELLAGADELADWARGVKIPDACIGLNIKCVTPFEMLRNERARFVLGT